ncbi:transposase [Streptomyces sp. NPDC058232]|uniref:transposase n=1 Tax=unclassified Streptomyces TaxID=2593676 RepID=UPI0036EEA687
MVLTSARKRGADTGPSPVDRRKTGSKHHLICDGRGTPLKVITTAANINDVTRTLARVDGIPPVAGSPGRPCRRPEALLGDKSYDSNSKSRRAARAPDPARYLTQGLPEHQGPGQASLRRRADLRPAPPIQTPRRPLGMPHRTPRCLRLPRLQSHLLAAAQEGNCVITTMGSIEPSPTSP